MATRTNDRLTCLILAGGRSSRMGTDKASLILQGTSFLDRAIILARKIGATSIQVLGRPDHPLGIRDREQFAGPARAIACWLQGAAPERRILALPVDMPLLAPEHLAPLLAEPGGAYFDDLYLPFTAQVPDSLDFEGQRMTALLTALGCSKLPVPSGWRAFLTNVNDGPSYELVKTHNRPG